MKVTIKQGNFEEEKCDIIINFVYIDINTGPASNIKLAKKAGEQFHYNSLLFKNNVKFTDCFTVVPGFTDCDIIFNSVVPEVKERYNETFFNIKNTLIEYAKYKLARTVVFSIDQDHWKYIIDFMRLYLGDLMFIKEIRIISIDEERVKLVTNYFKKTNTPKKIKNVFKKFPRVRNLS